LGFTTLPNRVVMGSMHVGPEEAPAGYDRMAAFYAQRARGGVAMIVTDGIAATETVRPSDDGALYRNGAEWQFRPIGQRCASGLRGIALDDGVNVRHPRARLRPGDGAGALSRRQ
ncbi:hypothetical protein VM98_35925, partial [Streptomyces rubellomurinus subsp. indigoferus]